METVNRRQLLQSATLAGAWPATASPARKRIATIITEYRYNSHADVIVGRLLEGYDYEGRRITPLTRVVSMYTDQAPSNDMSRPMAAKHDVKIWPTVRDALTLGTGALAVDGVVLVGEHGKYPHNEKGQHLYPRYELYKQIIDVFRESRRAVPVFCDKHLSVDWVKAKWMYDQSRELNFPLLAGSSLPLAWRRPPLELPLNCKIENAVTVFNGDIEAYGFHALETLQCMVERRSGGETGVAAVQCLDGEHVWRWTDANPWAERLAEQAIQRTEDRTPGNMRDNVKKPLLFVVDYRDGLRAAVYLLNGHVAQAGFAAAVHGQRQPVSTEVWLQPWRPFSHFSALVHYIERMIVTGRPAYPVERTLLTTGVLAALMDSSYRRNASLATPHLAVQYRAPKSSLFCRGPVPPMEPRKS
jgi:hypothetical protein